MRSLIATLILMGVWAADAAAQVRHEGYYRRDGTYVPPHYQTPPNDSRYDNWSTKGNTNPYTGKQGTVDPYKNPYDSNPYGSRRKGW